MKIPSLQTQIVISLLLGALAGLFFGEHMVLLEPIGRAFIMLLKMTILPYMSFSLIHALGGLTFDSARTILKKAILFLLVLWVVTALTVEAVSFIFPSESSPVIYSQLTPESSSSIDILGLFIPVNPVHAFANDLVPAVVLFSLLFGLALIPIKSKDTLLLVLDITVRGFTTIINWIIQLSPFGVFAIIAHKVGTASWVQIEQIRLYLITYAVGAFSLAFWIFPHVVGALTPVSASLFRNRMKSALLLSFSTANNLVILPVIIEAVKELAVEKGLDETSSRRTAKTMVPIAYNFPTSGNLFVPLFLIFLGFIYDKPLPWQDHGLMWMMSIPVLFGAAGSVVLGSSFLIDQLQLPADGFHLFLQTMPLTRNFQTMTSGAEIATLTLLVCFAYQGAVSIRWKRMLKGLISVVVGMALIISGLRYWLPPPSGPGDPYATLSVDGPVETTEVRPPSPHSVRTLDQIRDSRLLRVGVYPALPPFCYYNAKGELAGMDVAMAHRLAEDLGCSIEFVRLEYGRMQVDLDGGAYDIAMSATTVTESRLRTMRFTRPYLSPPIALVVPDYLRHRVNDDKNYLKRKTLRVAVLKGSSFEELAGQLFPQASIVELSDYDAFNENLADCLLWNAFEGTAWTLRFPKYSAVVPSFSLGHEHFAYPVAQQNEELSNYVDYWLELRLRDETLQKLQRKWILAEDKDQPERWSIMKDVLKWVE